MKRDLKDPAVAGDKKDALLSRPPRLRGPFGPFLLLLAAATLSKADPATLRWTNGESMTGDFTEASGTAATWKTPLFEQPLVLDWHAIHRVDWPPPPNTARPADPFMFSLRDGSSIYGNLISVTGSSVFIRGSRYGDAELKRSEVLTARRLAGGALAAAGPTGDAGWQGMEYQQDGTLKVKDSGDPGSDKVKIADFAAHAGALDMPYWHRAASLAIALPESIDIEFHIHSTGRPDFRLSLGDSGPSAMAIETWADEVVISTADGFKLVSKVGDNEHDVALRFCVDQRTGHCLVYTPAGDLIADWQAPPSLPHPTLLGLFLQNKGRDLTLDFLRVRKWAGAALTKIDLAQPRVELDDGRVLCGQVTSGSDGSIELTGQGTQPPAAFAPKDVDSLVFSPEPVVSGSAEATLIYGDGTYLLGRIDGISNGSATVETTFSTQPLTVQLSGLRQLFVNAPPLPGAAPEKPPAQLDRLTIGQTTFHGTFTAVGDENPRWLPVGGVAPIMLSGSIPYEIDRSFPEQAQFTAAPALFYTRAGDVLPGNMVALDRKGVEFDSGITELTKLPASELEAIQFGASGRMNLHGFTDGGWRIITGDDSKVRRTGDSIAMDPGTAIGHPAAMQSSDIRFNIEAGSFTAFRMRLFCAGTDPARCTSMLFGCTGGQVNFGMEATEGQFDDPHFEGLAPPGTIAVRLAITPDAVDLYLNGACVEKYPVSQAARAGTGLVIEPAAVWGNATRVTKISGFSTTSEPGCSWLPDVALDAKDQALTVPRFRRDDPPVHALIAANGDILRGEVEAATTANFGFRSGLDELTVPRDRVKAVVWLGKPLDSKPAADQKNPAAGLLGQRLRGRIMFGNGNLRGFISFIQNQAPGLKFQFPDDIGDVGAFSFQMGEEPISAALDRICALYGMTYRVDRKGVVVIEPASSRPQGLVEKMYWLKPGGFPVDAPAAKVLADNGIDFPNGASASWYADEGQLRMLNTAANQARLATLLGTKFAGIGSPTHWLLLASGARIALVAQKFGKNAITGWHPLYGRCTIPTADVAVISSSPIEPSDAMKSIADWRLVYAPEPVLPVEGGDSTASIGKPAADFTLSMLGGGKFQLSKQKGKVVVLDFWATWCGPCVRSLPGLIESMAGFSADRVKFIGVNEDEPAPEVKQFLETRGWNLAVALDDGSHVGQQYGVDGIPHTVIIGPDGNVAWVKTGYTPDGETDAAKEVTQLLAAPPAAGAQ